jgi:hypothetical protein
MNEEKLSDAMSILKNKAIIPYYTVDTRSLLAYNPNNILGLRGINKRDNAGKHGK